MRLISGFGERGSKALSKSLLGGPVGVVTDSSPSTSHCERLFSLFN